MLHSRFRPPFLVAARLGWSRVGREVGVFVFGQVVALAMGVVQLDAMVDWPATWALVDAAPAWAHGGVVAALLALFGLGARRFVRRTWLGSHEFLLRQPLSPVDRGLPSLALLGLIMVPLPLIGGLATGSAMTAGTWGLLGAVGLAGLAGPRGWGLGAVVGVGCAATLAKLHPGLEGLIAVATLAWGIPALGHAARGWAIEGSKSETSLLPRPTGPVLALLHRDTLVLAREPSRHLLEPWIVAAVLGVVVMLARRNNADSGGLVAGAGLVGLGLAGLVAHGGLTAVVRRLGRAFDPPHWPVRARQRAGALVLLAAGLVAPSWAVAAVGGWPVLSVADQLAQIAIWWGLAGAVAWTVVRRPGRPTLGTFLWWGLGLMGAGFVHQGLGFALGMVVLVVTGGALIRQIERTRRSS